ncbi:hypothetical protein ACLMJK_007414 [Lecanora helva]
MSNQAAVLKSAKARLETEDRAIPKPGQGEVLIRNVALATNPVDWKMQENGFMIESYPTVLGSDVAGTIEEIGQGVTRFNIGDRVAGFAHVLMSKNPDNAAFQRYTVVKACATVKLPDSVSFEEGSILPMSIATAGGGFFYSLGIPGPPQKQQGGFLVWGASSSVGSAVVHYANSRDAEMAASAGYTVYAVCSSRNFEYVKKLGAREAFDYNDASIVKSIIQSLKASSQQIVIGYDAISENGSSPQCAEIMDSFGGGKLCVTLPYPEDVRKPEGVEIVSVFAAKVASDKDTGGWLFSNWLEKSLIDKIFSPSPSIEKVDGGIGGVQKALDLHKQGLSSRKLVLTL